MMADDRVFGHAIAALFPFLRRHDPDQVQGSGSAPSQRRMAHPSE